MAHPCNHQENRICWIFVHFFCSVDNIHEMNMLKPRNLQALSPAESLAETGSSISDDNFVHGFFAALSVIIVSELGDKTFFIAAILSMKHPRLTVYLGRWLQKKNF